MRQLAKQAAPKLEMLVAGHPGSGKANFINRFLKYFPSSAEVRRKGDTMHFLSNLNEDIKIQLYDVNHVENVYLNSYDKMDVVVFYYAANDPQSFQNLEKWVSFMQVAVKNEEMLSSSLQPKKEALSFLVADLSNLGSQREATKSLAEKANKLKETFGIKRFIHGSFQDDESGSSVLLSIVHELYPPKPKEKSFYELSEESVKTLAERFSSDLIRQYVNEIDILNSKNLPESCFVDIQRMKLALERLQI